MAIENIVTAAKFDPTTPFATWDNVAKEYENSTEKIIFNLDLMTVRDAMHHNSYNASPTPISGDMLARYKAEKLTPSL